MIVSNSVRKKICPFSMYVCTSQNASCRFDGRSRITPKNDLLSMVKLQEDEDFSFLISSESDSTILSPVREIQEPGVF